MAATTALPNTYATGRLAKPAPWLILVGSMAVSLLAFVLLEVAGTTESLNITGAIVVGAILFAVLLFVSSWLIEGSRRAKDRLITTLVSAAFLIALAPLISLVITVIVSGSQRFDLTFFTWSMRNIVGEGGGFIHAITGTVLMTLTAAVISVPVGLLTSIYLVEYGRGPLARAITFLVDVMTGIPSIVAGLFAYAAFALLFGPGTKIGFAGAVSLAVIMIPVVVRSSEDMLRVVPNELREAALALGVPRWLVILKVVLPTSIAGITTGVMLAIARVIGETAPLLVAAGFTNNMNYNLFEGRMQSLPVAVYNSYVSQGTDSQSYLDRAWAGALTLILIVMLLNIIARLIARYFAPKTGR
ncbi:phosphate ABC transporter membrane protein 2, PhoT family [Paramicrobacterium humi]|uniref:Phosphate transport system permease protein PstA n=1 Tax=Paramicrobacterium humi TaxID=640635 RepID=A0A1H4NQT7_9MICO|nr:phosphate ABC transporter permease PstA [Microbacterium humi]SEB97002.1 phosphate ABC transporter membrane protein 2, PhoT family [Microbacterium humi]